MWIWEHQGSAPGGDEKQEREEWHVSQEGAKLTGYYDRVVHQISIDGHAYRCSMALEFQIATRYQISGEVRGNQVIIYENSFEVLSPNACDNGKRRLDAYEGQASDRGDAAGVGRRRPGSAAAAAGRADAAVLVDGGPTPGEREPRIVLAPLRQRRCARADSHLALAPFSFSSASMTVLNSSTGWAPTRRVPLTKNVGVPVAPTAAPSLASASTLSLNLPQSSAALNLAMLRPSSSAYFSSDGRSSACWLANSLSCISQNLPCSLAASAASAARCALSWNGSGSCLNAILILPLYSSSICFSVGHGAAAERALEVAELDQRDRGRRRALDRRVADLDVDLGLGRRGRRRRRRGGGASGGLLHQLLVDVLERRPLLDELVGLLDLLVDDLLELVEAGCAPTSSRPLMKKVGVPLAPTAVASLLVCVDLVLDLGIVPCPS